MLTIGWNDGHTLSGPGTGAVGIIKETDRNRAIGKLARKYLLENYENVKIINCTVDKSNNDLAAAVKIANDNKVDVFISNHVNAGGGVGFEGFYSRFTKNSDVAKGKVIYDALCNTKSCLKARRYCDDFSYKRHDLYVLRNTVAPAFLFEIGFVDNKKCVEAVNNDEVARAYAEGIAKAYGLKKKVNRQANINKKENDVKVDYIIQYSNPVDQNIAEMMADRLNCPTINCLRPYKYYNQYKNVIAVGEAKNKSGYTNVVIKGKDRKETLNNAIAYLEKLGR